MCHSYDSLAESFESKFQDHDSPILGSLKNRNIFLRGLSTKHLVWVEASPVPAAAVRHPLGPLEHRLQTAFCCFRIIEVNISFGLTQGAALVCVAACQGGAAVICGCPVLFRGLCASFTSLHSLGLPRLMAFGGICTTGPF